MIDHELLETVTDKLQSNLAARLRLDGIDRNTRKCLDEFAPIFEENILDVVSDFYSHMGNIPSAAKYFKERDVPLLKKKQVEHWRLVFAADFNRDFIYGAVRIGFIHHQVGLPLFLYLAGYNRVLCNLTGIAISHYSGALKSRDTVNALIKVVSLDMDIAISCYFLADHVGLEKKGEFQASYSLN